MSIELNPFKMKDVTFVHGEGGLKHAINNFLDSTFNENAMPTFKVSHNKEPFYPAVVVMTAVWHDGYRFDHVACVWYTPDEVKAKLQEMLTVVEENVKHHNESSALTQTMARQPADKPEFPKNTIQSEATSPSDKPKRPDPPPLRLMRETLGGMVHVDNQGRRIAPPPRRT